MGDRVSLATNPLGQLALDELRTRTSMKWRTHPADVLPLWVAEMDVPLAAPVKDAVRSALERGDTGYATGIGYASAFQQFAAHRWSWAGLELEQTAIVPDVMLGIVEALRLLTGPGDVVVVTPPVYAPFYAFVEHENRLILEAPLSGEGRLDPSALEVAFAEAARRCPSPTFLLCNPHNPTGTVHSREELGMVATLARRHGIRVISDEIHAPLALDGVEFVPYLSVPGSENGMSLASASKAWNLAGLKAALLVAGHESLPDLARLPEEVSHGVSHLAVIGHAAAFQDGGTWLDSLLSGLSENRHLLEELVARHLPQARLRRPEGSYLAWIDCSKLGFEEEPHLGQRATVAELEGPAQFFLDHARVALSSGHVFGTGGHGHVRLNFATNPLILELALRRMGDAARARD
ncbi:aminotransferase class I/II-fold pyridoxal phosphate-dependent enzyme [Plantibacter sp. MCCC 1A11337]|nr:aminotransferase class I/II-fold pyridoxal phosphate-dependent enzyme [Plantibacter sp. MCCC 1A11337]